MNRIKKIVLLVVVITAVCARAQAQEAAESVDAVQAEERLTKLEKIVSKLPTISGFVNFRYQYNSTNDANSFDVRRARLDVKGDIARDKVGYRLQVEFAGTPKILDAYVTWKICDYVGMQAGQFKTPFSLENPYSPTGLETTDNSMVISNLAGYSDVSGISANGRDLGLGFNGNFLKRDGFSIINWSVGVFNGSGINRTDNNRQKDYSGILTVKPIKHLSLAAYHYNGWGYNAANDVNFRRVRSGTGAKYDDGRWLVRGEYIWGKTGSTNSEGAYGVVGYHFHKTVQAVLKYDYWKRDLTDKNTRWNNYTAGVNYTPIKYCKLQLNYSYRTSPGAEDHHYVVMQVFGMF